MTQPPDSGAHRMLSFYCKDLNSSTGDDCATFYRTNVGTWIVQGDQQGEQVRAQLIALKPTETFCEIPENLVDQLVRMYAKERYGVDLAGAARRAAPGCP
ncbi:hypothetical protein [Actinomadura sp. 6N118]|uniref:hypothetical protein n=1 Tax=Actinomadura sp. 6N118 TaxID=3375151 RepID=UPI0037AE17C4